MPGAGVVPPIATLFIVPVAALVILITPLPVVDKLILFAPAASVTWPLVADKLVNAPDAGVVPPIDILLIEPVVPGLIVTDPDPVGEIVTLALAGLIETVEVAVNVVKLPGFGVDAPIVTLSNVPATAGLINTELVTTRFGVEKLLCDPIVSVLVSGFVEIVIPLLPTTVNVLLVAFKLICDWLGEAMYVYPFMLLLLQVIILLSYLLL